MYIWKSLEEVNKREREKCNYIKISKKFLFYSVDYTYNVTPIAMQRQTFINTCERRKIHNLNKTINVENLMDGQVE